MKIRVGMSSSHVSSGFLRYDKSFVLFFVCFVLFCFFCFFFLGGVLKIKVGGRSRDCTEICIVVLPYQEPEGINSYNPGQPIPLQDFDVSTLV